jgi:hypothetical protein
MVERLRCRPQTSIVAEGVNLGNALRYKRLLQAKGDSTANICANTLGDAAITSPVSK